MEVPEYRSLIIRQVDNGFVVGAYGGEDINLFYTTYSEASNKIEELFQKKRKTGCRSMGYNNTLARKPSRC